MKNKFDRIDKDFSPQRAAFFNRPHWNPNDFKESARSREGGSPARPAGRWSLPT